MFSMVFSPFKHGKRKTGRSKGVGNKSFHVSLEMVDFLLFLGPLILRWLISQKLIATNLPESTGMEPLLPFLCWNHRDFIPQILVVVSLFFEFLVFSCYPFNPSPINCPVDHKPVKKTIIFYGTSPFLEVEVIGSCFTQKETPLEHTRTL